MRGGSLIPLGPDVLFAINAHWTRCPCTSTPVVVESLVLYEDDGDTWAYERGEYARTRLSYREGPVQQVVIAATEGTFMDCPPAARGTWCSTIATRRSASRWTSRFSLREKAGRMTQPGACSPCTWAAVRPTGRQRLPSRRGQRRWLCLCGYPSQR